MPVTPFHFGPGAALHGLAPRHVSFVAFCAANVLIDIESGYNLLRGADHVHTFLHTYGGATLVVLAVLALHRLLRTVVSRWPVPDLWAWVALPRRPVAIGAMLGAYSHIVLDSVMHADIAPLMPFSQGNALLGALSWDGLHLLCAGCGVAGLILLGARRAFSRIAPANGPQAAPSKRQL